MIPGQLLGGRYRLDKPIGAGGMGEVWRSTDLVLNRVVAVKIVLAALLDDPEFVRRFLIEARAMASVRHPNVVAIHDFHADGAGAYLVMEYVEGESLDVALRRLGRLGPADTMVLLAQAADALQAVHERGIVHRDVKPANLLVRPNGTIVLTDFGIAFDSLGTGTGLTGTGAVIGTPSYLSPEQILGQPATARSDVYSLGIVGYECLAGRRPFVGENPFAVALQRVHSTPPPLPPDVPRLVAAVVDRALATDPGLRFPSAAELAQAARHTDSTVFVPGPGQLPPSRPSRQPGHPPLAPVPVYGPGPGPGPGGSVGTGLVGPGPASGRRWRLAAIIAIVAVLVGLGAAGAAVGIGRLHLLGTGAVASGPTAGPTGGPAAPTGSAPPVATTGGSPHGVPVGFAVCGAGFCPKSPLCWGGLTAIGGLAFPAQPENCGGPHVWQTFAALYQPDDAAKVRQDSLMQRPDVAAVCSDAMLAARSINPAKTRGWDRDVWPVPADPTTTLLHCLVHANGEDSTTLSVIKPA